jgi:hypothetical protein
VKRAVLILLILVLSLGTAMYFAEDIIAFLEGRR